MISLGGGGEYFTLDNPQGVPNFVNSVTSIVTEYGFEGMDIDFETPSLDLAPGDADFRASDDTFRGESDCGVCGSCASTSGRAS